MSRLVFRNKTDYPDAEVKRLVRFAFADLELPGRGSVLIRVGHTKIRPRRRRHGSVYGASGCARDYVEVKRDTPKGAWWEVFLWVGRPDEFPVEWYDPHRQGIGTLSCWREALVAIAAHEGKHVELFQRRARRKLSGFQTEERCESYAARRMAAFRAAAE